MLRENLNFAKEIRTRHFANIFLNIKSKRDLNGESLNNHDKRGLEIAAQ